MRMVVMMLVIVIVVMIAAVVVCVLVDDELRRRHAGAKDTLGVDVITRYREAAKRASQLVERQPGVEQRTEHHVARDAGETIEVEHATHRSVISLKLQYLTSPRMM